jgi:hypothetical protein
MSRSDNDFMRILSELRGGLVSLDLSRRQTDLVKACREAGKKGKITLELTYEPRGAGNREMHITPKIKMATPPAPDLEERSIFFTGDNGQLHRHDPNQGDLYRGPKLAADGSSPAEQRTGTDD